jgi:hypothetical protein
MLVDWKERMLASGGTSHCTRVAMPFSERHVPVQSEVLGLFLLLAIQFLSLYHLPTFQLGFLHCLTDLCEFFIYVG